MLAIRSCCVTWIVYFFYCLLVLLQIVGGEGMSERKRSEGHKGGLSRQNGRGTLYSSKSTFLRCFCLDLIASHLLVSDLESKTNAQR